jgi:hypothetical protein
LISTDVYGVIGRIASIDIDTMYAPNLPVLHEVFLIKLGTSKSSVEDCIYLFNEYLEISQSAFITKVSSEVRRTFSSILNGENKSFEFGWLEKHDSVILVSKNELSSMSTIRLIYLEGWNSPVMSDVQSGRETVATSCIWNAFCLGQFSSDEDCISSFKEFFTAFKKSLLDLKIRNTSTILTHLYSKLYPRSAGITNELSSNMGQNKRGASWCLVKAVIDAILHGHLLPDDEYIFQKMEVDFYVWLLEMMNVDCGVPTQHVDTFVQAHRTASEKCAELAEKEIDTKDTSERLRLMWWKLETARNDADLRADLCLQSDSDTSSLDPSIRLPSESSQSSTLSRSTSDIQRDVSSNLGALSPFPSFLLSTEEPQTILQWLSNTSNCAAPKRAALQLMVSSVEHWFFCVALNLGKCSDRAALNLSKCSYRDSPRQSFISDVVSILIQHRTNYAELRPLLECSNLMEVELRSLEVLCVWIAHCMVHSTATKEHPQLGQYDVAIKWSDLHHLVFSEKAPTDAALAVAAYLKGYTKSCAVIFSLSDQSGTFKMAKEFSLQNKNILLVWEEELKTAEKKRKDNFVVVQQKQRSANQLRDKIANHEESLRALEKEHADNGPYNKYHRQCQYTLDRISDEKNDILKYNQQLITVLKSPPMVLQALPTDEGAAMIMLFFCYMPEYLRTLARLTIMAQQMLLPRAPFLDNFSGNITHTEMAKIHSF